MSAYKWYGDEPDVPLNLSGYADAISFYDEMDSNLFDCVDGSNRQQNQLINSVIVSHEYPVTVNSSDSILVRISSYMAQKQFWFMIGGVNVECTGWLSIYLTPVVNADIIFRFCSLPSGSAAMQNAATRRHLLDSSSVDGYWNDDFVYVEKASVTVGTSTTDIYDDGWYEREL